jgi:hypothetical protein
VNDEEPLIFADYKERTIRLTQERRSHTFEHPEMVSQLERIRETLAQPELVVATAIDETVHVYHRLYSQTPVTRKHLLVAVKMLGDDAFVLTAFFSNRQKKGTTIWQA